MAAPELISENDDGSITVAVHAQPGAGRTHVTGRHGDAVKIRVAAPPEGGRANQALCGVLAEVFGVAGKDVKLIAGDNSRSKHFQVTGVGHADAIRLLDRAMSGAGRPGRSGPDRERNPFGRR